MAIGANPDEYLEEMLTAMEIEKLQLKEAAKKYSGRFA